MTSMEPYAHVAAVSSTNARLRLAKLKLSGCPQKMHGTRPRNVLFAAFFTEHFPPYLPSAPRDVKIMNSSGSITRAVGPLVSSYHSMSDTRSYIRRRRSRASTADDDRILTQLRCVDEQSSWFVREEMSPFSTRRLVLASEEMGPGLRTSSQGAVLIRRTVTSLELPRHQF